MSDEISPHYLKGPRGGRLAYNQLEGKGPTVVFLGGLMSDMGGTKAVFLENWARLRGQPFLRFDYSGHGASDEKFTDGSVLDWAEDAAHIIDHLTEGQVLLVGSSMGGWIGCDMLRRFQNRIVGFICIAAAPDFSEDEMWMGFTPAQKSELETKGVVHLPSDYGAPYPITKKFIEDGRKILVLRDPLVAQCPVRLFQGEADADVSVATALKLFNHLQADDAQLKIVKGSDHRFSSERELALISAALEEILELQK